MIPLSDEAKSHTFPFITLGIIALNVYAFFLELTTSNPGLFISQYALIPATVDFSSLDTLIPFVTSMFLHGGFMHIISNMLFLWIFGDNIEDIFGRIQFLFIYLVSGIAAGYAQYMINPESTIPMLGASGAVAGILGAYIIRFPHSRVTTIIPPFFFGVAIPAFIMIGFWFITQIFSGLGTLGTTDAGGVAWWAHIGGFITGLVLSFILPHDRSKTELRRID